MSKDEKKIYLDYAAATPIKKEVLRAMMPFFSIKYANPSSLYDAGVAVKSALDGSRKICAEILRARPENIVFTAGGTEGDNLAIMGAASAISSSKSHKQKMRVYKKGHIVTTAIEHGAVLEPIKKLAARGWEITFVSVGRDGLVNPDAVIKAIRPGTVLISVMYANNEIGAIEPIAEIGRQLLRYRTRQKSVYPYFHTDACQAAGALDLNVEKLHVDLMTLNAGKIYGPKGSGLLYVRGGTKLAPIQHGGDHEFGLRPGTENLPGVVGLTRALELARRAREAESKRLRTLSEFFWRELKKNIPGVVLNGPEIGDRRLPNNINVSLPWGEAEIVLLYLNAAGIMCATGSACAAQASAPSHVLAAIGLSREQSRRSLRFSFGESTSKSDLALVVKRLKAIKNLV